VLALSSGLPRYARNDGQGTTPPNVDSASHTFIRTRQWYRHHEERSDEAIQTSKPENTVKKCYVLALSSGLPRYARNDGQGTTPRNVDFASHTFIRYPSMVPPP